MLNLSQEFPQTEGLLYLNHAAVAPWPQRSSLAVQRFAIENCQIGARDYPNWLRIEARLRARLKRLINAPSTDDIALVKNTSEALSFVAFGLDWREGDQVVISNEEFPSNRIVWQALAPRGVEVIQVDLQSSNPEQALLDACGPRTRLLAISSVQYASGLRLEMERIAHGCQQKGVLLCIDAIQHLGAQPFDVQDYNCAFAMADGHKWLMGPEGLGVFYCRSDLREQLSLHEYGWHMIEHIGDYSRSDWIPAHSARRFECGSPNMLGAMALEASLSLLEEAGIDQVAQALEVRIHQLQQGLQKLNGAQLHTPLNPAQRAGIITFSFAHKDNSELFSQLTAQQLVCAQRGQGIRLSPHFYTPLSVIEQSLALITQLSLR